MGATFSRVIGGDPLGGRPLEHYSPQKKINEKIFITRDPMPRLSCPIGYSKHYLRNLLHAWE